MKKFLKYLLIAVLFSAWGIILTNREQTKETVRVAVKYFQKPCSEPIKYSIGQVDTRYGISRERFQEIVMQAEVIWEKELGKNLFQYDPKAEFGINLVFDERQAGTIESEKMEEKLENIESSYSATEKEYDSLSAVYKKRVPAYENHVAEYEKKLDKYNGEVAYWNAKGGAPEDKYEDLEDDKKDLREMFSALEKERKEVNALAGKTNNLANKSNTLAENYNQNLNTYKNKFGEAVQFDKGVYDGFSISIYQFYEETDLRLTLAHELGHALGIEHVENPESLMYYLMGEQDMENPKLSGEDLAAVRGVCHLK